MQVHFDDSRFVYVDNLTGDFSAMDGKILDFKCNFVVATQSENKTESNNQNSNNLENLILDNIDLIKKLEKQIEQLEIRIAKLEENKNIEQVMSSVEGHSIRCEYFGGWSGFIIYARPFTSTHEFFTKYQDGIYSLSGTAIVEGKDLNTQIPISYLASKKGDTWDVVDDGLNERMGSAGDGDTVDQIGELPKTSCLIDTIIAK